MGFSYSAFGLCCDFCYHDKSDRLYVKKINCPYGFCQSWAICDQCFKLKKHFQSSCTNENKTHKEICKKRSNDLKNNKEFQTWINKKEVLTS